MERVFGGLLDKKSLHLGMNPIIKQIGNRIRSIRRGRMPEITIEDLAERSGLSRQTISAIENGKNIKVSVVSLAKIAKALEIPMARLLDDEFSYLQIAAESPAAYKTKKRNDTN